MARAQINSDLDRVVATRIGVPAIRRAVAMLHDAAQANAPGTRVWVTSRDERVRPTHVGADAQTIPDNLRFKVENPKVPGQYELARHPRDPALSKENAINCFPGSTLVQPLGDLLAVWRAPYESTMLHVRTMSGRVLSGTPNHPVLTPTGMRPLGALDEGDHLIYGGFRQAPLGSTDPCEGVSVLSSEEAPHVDRGPALLAEVFVSAAHLFGSHRMVGLAVDLYGDPLDGEVEVVAIDRHLRDRLEPSFVQGEGQFSLPDTCESSAVLVGAGTSHHFHVPSRAAASSLVRGSREGLAILGRGSRHPHNHRVATASALYPGVTEPDLHNPTIHAERPRDSQLGLPGEVAPDQIVHIEVDHGFRGHVYTLTTTTDRFLAEGFVVSNCRCDDPPLSHPLRESITATEPVQVGNRVTGEVETRFPRAAESEFGTSEDTAAHYMTNALREVAARLRAGHAR